MWPRKKFWWETGGTPPQQSPNPEARVFAGNPMHQWQLGMLMPTVPLRTFDKWDVRRGYDPRFSADTSDTYPNTGPPGWAPKASAQTPQYDHTMGAGAGTAPTPFTRRKGGFKRVLKHLAAMESPGPDWSLEAKKYGTDVWGIANTPWEALSPGQDWLERQRKKERPA